MTVAEELHRNFQRVAKQLAELDRAQRPTALDLMLTVGPRPHLKPGEKCPLCGQHKRKMYAERAKE